VTKPLYKLSIRLGADSFDGEGAEESVRADYAAFIAAIGNRANHAADPMQPTLDELLYGADPKAEPRLSRFMREIAWVAKNDLTAAELLRVFALESGVTDFVVLKNLPTTENRTADALLLLIHGADKLLGTSPVRAAELFLSARHSHLEFDRLDRAIAPYKEFLTIEGETRGTRYSLNTQGQAHAIRTARMMLEK